MALKATLHIETALRNERTILHRSFCTPPFKVADVTEDKKSKTLQLMLMCSSPGVLDGDDYNLQLHIAEDCKLNISTQSYQRLFQMKSGASQTMQVHLKKGSSLTYLPHPVVPHQNAVFCSRNKIFLEEGSSLIWGEVISCGRAFNGEVFQFSSYHSITEIFREQKLVVKENVFLQPSQMPLSSMGQLEGYTHQATLLCIHEEANVPELIDIMLEAFKEEKEIAFGISALPVNGIAVRILGYKAEQLFELTKKAAAIFSSLIKKAVHVE